MTVADKLSVKKQNDSLNRVWLHEIGSESTNNEKKNDFSELKPSFIKVIADSKLQTVDG